MEKLPTIPILNSLDRFEENLVHPLPTNNNARGGRFWGSISTLEEISLSSLGYGRVIITLI